MNNKWEKGTGGIQGSTKQPTLEEQKVLLIVQYQWSECVCFESFTHPNLGGWVRGSIPFIPSGSVLLCSNKLTHKKPIVCHFINVYNM